jgi:hypothetical protein
MFFLSQTESYPTFDMKLEPLKKVQIRSSLTPQTISEKQEQLACSIQNFLTKFFLIFLEFLISDFIHNFFRNLGFFLSVSLHPGSFWG